MSCSSLLLGSGASHLPTAIRAVSVSPDLEGLFTIKEDELQRQVVLFDLIQQRIQRPSKIDHHSTRRSTICSRHKVPTFEILGIEMG